MTWRAGGWDRRSIGVWLASALTLALAGCAAQSSTLASLVEGSVAFKICDSVEADAIVVETFDESDPAYPDLTEVWALAGAGQSVPEGATIVLGQTPPGYEVEFPYVEGSVDLARDGLVISFLRTGGSNDVAQFELAILKEGVWIDSLGQAFESSDC